MVLIKLSSIFICVILLHFIFCEVPTDFLNESISNPIIFAERKNHVLFALSKAANESTFENLKNAFLKLETHAESNSSNYVFYDTAISFGTAYSKNFTIVDRMYEKYGYSWCKKNDSCFESSRTENVEQVVTKYVTFNEPCPKRSYKKFFFIISDLCLPFLNKQFDDYQKCSSDYRKIILMLPTINDINECKKQIGTEYIELFSSELQSNELTTYSDMNVNYESTWMKSIFNIFVIVDKKYEKALTTMFTPPEINYPDYNLCNQGSLVAYFQFIDVQYKVQAVANMTAPVNFADSKFIVNNYYTLLTKRSKPEALNCDFVNSYLTTIKDMPLADGKYQYNLLILSDPYPKCLKSDLLWNSTNRHLEIVVFGVEKPANDYSQFISFSNNSFNHLSYYTAANEGMSTFWSDTSVCRTHMPSKNITDDLKPQLITTTPSNSSQSEDNKLWIIIGGVVVVLLLIGGFLLIYLKLRNVKNIESDVNWSIKESPSPSTLSSFINKAFPDISVEESNVFINFDEILGQGSTCTVYQAKLKTMEEKTFAIKIPLQYENSHLEEVMHEISIVKRLGQHSSICLPILCTSHREIPCIMFEKMDTSLLFFVKNYFKNGVEFPPKMLFLQILWQISNALEFIASKNIIHRDIAARNILFSTPNIAKLSDFGLWCECNTDSQIYFSSFRKKLPFKWLSIEAMKDKIFSEKSDVWSFGIVMYEMWSGGNVPYADIDANELVEFLLDGKRLEPPESMDNDVAEIMASCWKGVKEERPNFNELKTKFCNLLENERPEKYNKMN